METSLRKSYAEVRAVLEVLGDFYKERVPKEVLDLFYSVSEYNVEFDKNIPVEQIEISKDALTIICILNLKYWETDPQKRKELKEIVLNCQQEVFLMELKKLRKKQNKF